MSSRFEHVLKITAVLFLHLFEEILSLLFHLFQLNSFTFNFVGGHGRHFLPALHLEIMSEISTYKFLLHSLLFILQLLLIVYHKSSVFLWTFRLRRTYLLVNRLLDLEARLALFENWMVAEFFIERFRRIKLTEHILGRRCDLRHFKWISE
jgi:hypothetical protein